MAIERNPNDPYRADDPYLASNRRRPVDPTLADEDIGHSSRLDSDLQVDPELAEGPSSGPKIALFAVAIALLLGAVFYGLNNSSIQPNGTSSTSAPATAQNTAPTPPPAASPGNAADNAKPGVTTGAAPAQNPPPPAPVAPTPAPNAPASK
jgi:hypothetical protein